MSRAKRAFIAAINLYRFLRRKEGANTAKVPLLTRLRMLRKGFLSVSYVLYDGFRQHPSDAYFSDWLHTRVALVNGRWGSAMFPAVLANKIFFTEVVGKHIPVSPIFAYIDRGRIHSLDSRWNDQADLRTVLAAFDNPVVFKPVAGMQGQGIYFIGVKDGSLTINGKAATDDEVHKRISRLHEYIISGFITQGESPGRLYPHSTNTMRMLTIWDVDAHRPFIAAAVHRIGTAESAPLDSWSRGGLGAAIDVETGVIGPATRDPIGLSRLEWFERHPDTGQPIAGQRIPSWNEVCEGVLKAATALPYLKFIGWDIIQTEDGICALEANSACGVRFLQVHRPLLIDPRVRRFFEHHGFLKPTTRPHTSAPVN